MLKTGDFKCLKYCKLSKSNCYLSCFANLQTLNEIVKSPYILLQTVETTTNILSLNNLNLSIQTKSTIAELLKMEHTPSSYTDKIESKVQHAFII